MTQWTHFDEQGQAHMVDLGSKAETERRAIAEGWILMAPQTLSAVMAGNSLKGDVLGVARIAGIMATKRTADLVPLCHPLALSHASVAFEPDESQSGIYCRVTVKTRGQTGVEMEALTGVQVALLTIYDMCKALDRGMQMTDIGLVQKEGGRSGTWIRGRSSRR